MVSILLMFTPAQRDGWWGLYMHTFHLMMPYMFRYDHFLHVRWSKYSSKKWIINQLLHEFNSGNFVVNWNASKFNQVSPYHSLESLNGIERRGGSIVGITKTSSALTRWALSYNLRSQIADKTQTMLGLRHEFKFSHELTPASKHRDNMEESSLCPIFEEYKVFSPTAHPDFLYNIATKPRERPRHGRDSIFAIICTNLVSNKY